MGDSQDIVPESGVQCELDLEGDEESATNSTSATDKWIHWTPYSRKMKIFLVKLIKGGNGSIPNWFRFDFLSHFLLS